MDERLERRVLEKAEYVGDAVTILAGKRDSLTAEAYRANREQRDVVERESKRPSRPVWISAG